MYFVTCRHCILVVVDYYIRYYEVAITTSTTSSQIIKLMDDMFAVHGLPITLSSDQGPQFVSKEFEDFLEDNNISYRKVTPLWAEANGEMERQNRSLLKCMKITQSEGRDWRKELTKYLKAYRMTPHSVIGLSLRNSCSEGKYERNSLNYERNISMTKK